MTAGTDTGIAIYNKYMSTTMQSSQVGIAAHIGGMGTGGWVVVKCHYYKGPHKLPT